MMGINLIAVLIATVAQFVIGAIWYMPVFGKLWGEIHGFPKLSKAEQAAAQKQMIPMLAIQFVGTVLITLALAKIIALASDYNVYKLTAIAWIGFFVPTQVSGVLFGGTDPKWVIKKILVLSGGSLVTLVAAATILSLMR